MSKDKGYLIPDVIDPPDTVCIRIEVPNDDKHFYAFWGALDTLGIAHSWVWDGLKSGKAVAQVWRDTIETARQTLGACDLPIDCDEVENCIVVSPTIVNIDASVELNETNIINNTTDIQEIEENPPDGNTYDPPSPVEGSDEACQIAGHLASRIGDYIAQIDTYSTEPTLMDALSAAMSGQFNYAVDDLITAFGNFFTGGALPLFSDYQSQQSDVHEEIYCSNDLSKDNLASWSVGNLNRGQEISDMLNSIALATWQQWQVLGQHATGYDCSSFPCGGWCYNFDFTQGIQGWSTLAELGRDFGIYNGSAWVSEWGFVGVWDERLYIHWPFDNQTDCNRVEVELTVTGILGSAPDITVAVLDILAPDPVITHQYALGNQTIAFDVIPTHTNVVEVRIIVVAGSAGDGDIDIAINSVKITGETALNAHSAGDNC